jgi:hypothetical protein
VLLSTLRQTPGARTPACEPDRSRRTVLVAANSGGSSRARSRHAAVTVAGSLFSPASTILAKPRQLATRATHVIRSMPRRAEARLGSACQIRRYREREIGSSRSREARRVPVACVSDFFPVRYPCGTRTRLLNAATSRKTNRTLARRPGRC